MTATLYAEVRARLNKQLTRQERLLAAIDRFFADQERATGRRWTDETFSVKARSSRLVEALRAGRVISPEVCDAADALIRAERGKWLSR